MVKGFKIFMSSVLVSLSVLMPIGACFAEEVSPMYIPKEGYYYVPSTKSTSSIKIDWSHLHSNPSSVSDSVTYTTTRSRSTTANVSTNAVFNSMVAQVGVGYEVGLNSTDTVSTSITYGIPAYSTYLLRAGSRLAKASGTQQYYVNGTLTSSKSVSGTWTYQGYSDKIQQ